MTPMRILHVVARSHLRGAEKVALELCDELDALGHTTCVVALGLAHDGGSIEELPPLVARSGVGPDVLALSAYRLRRKLKEWPADVVLAHGGWAVQVTILAMTPRPRGTHLVWQRILGVPDRAWHPVRSRWWRAVASRIDAAVALTPALEDEVRRMGFDGEVWVIPNSRRPDRFVGVDRVEAAEHLRAAVGLPATVPILGFVGHLVRQKRPERAIEVLARVRAAGTDAHLVVVGDGPLRGLVERAIAERGLAEHVTMLGFRADVEHVLGAIDLLMLTSDSEGIPGVAIEAQMAGCPVVTFPLGGVDEVLVDGVTGVVLPRADVALMADKVVELLTDPIALAAMGTAGRARAPEFAASHTAAMYADRFGKLTGKAPSTDTAGDA